jgi:hypothetical protein
MISFEEIFSTETIPMSDVADMRNIFNNIVSDIIEGTPKDETYDVTVRNNLLYNTISYLATKEVLFSIQDLMEKADIPNTVRGKFNSYYASMIQANASFILSEDLSFRVFRTEFPIPSIDIAMLIVNFFNYFSAAREKAFTETLILMENMARTTAESVTKSIVELCKFKKEETTYDEMVEKAKEVFVANSAPNMYNDFMIIVELSNIVPVNYKVLVGAVYEKIRDPEIHSLELQRKYLLSVLKKDKSYNHKRAYINKLINAYSSKIDRVEREIKKDEERTRKLYSEHSEVKVDEFISELFD